MRTAKQREDFKAWSLKNRDHLRRREKMRHLTKRAQCLVSYARKRARRNGVPFDLDGHVDAIQKRIDSGTCELTGIPFTLDGGRRWDCPSLDRKDPAKGYVYSNIRVILMGLNFALGNWGADVLVKMVAAMEERSS